MMKMVLRATPPFSYAKVDKVDADEARHLQAQFLIHRVLEESCWSAPARARRRPAAFLATGGKARQIGVRLKRLRLAARSVWLRLCRSLQRQLRRLRKFVRGSTVQRQQQQLGSPSSSSSS
ncbi:hypothetical protein GUJ93_ZPchr0007g4403 [Zizania palustris]|uniref:Uncharacterized protein n=1 Tax=Zizania palustris TaxID=103762 RepID=A0A8J5TEE5_ZIZPA|nr:hypothetical protein GUJ93_ZPchr0007g4403 [Zizania palustris]